MPSAHRPRNTYKEKTILNLLHVYTSPNHGSSALRYWPVTHVTHLHLSTHLTHDPWPADPLSALGRSVLDGPLFWLSRTTNSCRCLYIHHKTIKNLDLIQAYLLSKSRDFNFSQGTGFDHFKTIHRLSALGIGVCFVCSLLMNMPD